MKNEWHKDRNIYTKPCLDIISDASISSVNIANGKNIPLVILDTTEYKEIEKAILFHSGINYGKITTIWGKSSDDTLVTLWVNCLEPVPVEFVIPFDVENKVLLIDLIIKTQLLYIQQGKPGDRFKNTMNSPRIMIEIPSTHFYNEWYKLYEKYFTKHFQKKGMNRKIAKSTAVKLYSELSKIRDFRIK